MIRAILLLLILIPTLPADVFATCIRDSEICAEGAETRIINGHGVYKSCWRWTSDFTCDGTVATPDTHCQELVDEGCTPLSSVCDTDSCVQTYECDVTTTTIPTGVGCEAQTMAVNGLEFDTGYPPNTDFGQAAANLAALESAVTGMIKDDSTCSEQPVNSGNYVCIDPIQIFTGTDRMCRKDSLGFNKCCDGSGWGTNSELAVCNTEEEILGFAREQGRAVYVGRYCRHSNIFGCYAHGYVYCTFNTEIGRIIQQQGRPQLGIGWGSATSPNCRGLSPVELASIDFDAIDFSDYFADAFADTIPAPTGQEMENIVDSFITRLTGAGCSQFDQGCIGSF